MGLSPMPKKVGTGPLLFVPMSRLKRRQWAKTHNLRQFHAFFQTKRPHCGKDGEISVSLHPGWGIDYRINVTDSATILEFDAVFLYKSLNIRLHDNFTGQYSAGQVVAHRTAGSETLFLDMSRR